MASYTMIIAKALALIANQPHAYNMIFITCDEISTDTKLFCISADSNYVHTIRKSTMKSIDIFAPNHVMLFDDSWKIIGYTYPSSPTIFRLIK